VCRVSEFCAFCQDIKCVGVQNFVHVGLYLLCMSANRVYCSVYTFLCILYICRVSKFFICARKCIARGVRLSYI